MFFNKVPEQQQCIVGNTGGTRDECADKVKRGTNNYQKINIHFLTLFTQ